MRDMDTLRIKIKKILDNSLTDRELLMLGTITVKKSSADLREEELYRQGIELAEKENLRIKREETYQMNIDGIAILAEHIGRVKLPYNTFTLGVSEYFALKGKVTKPQEEALLNTRND